MTIDGAATGTGVADRHHGCEFRSWARLECLELPAQKGRQWVRRRHRLDRELTEQPVLNPRIVRALEVVLLEVVVRPKGVILLPCVRGAIQAPNAELRARLHPVALHPLCVLGVLGDEAREVPHHRITERTSP